MALETIDKTVSSFNIVNLKSFSHKRLVIMQSDEFPNTYIICRIERK